ncbi:MAG: tail fiber domain-containing protein, partial [Phycisphaerae bacterium]
GGGEDNIAKGLGATIGGGAGNMALGELATVPGGALNEAEGLTSFAAGRRAKANHDGAFVWGDSIDADVSSFGNDTFSIRASGGTRFYSSSDPNKGVKLLANDSQWLSLSDRNAKENFEKVDSREILERLAAMPIETWTYRGQDDSIRHIGPMAQDFHAAFGVGPDDKHIGTMDADGVALAAIQGLLHVVRDKEKEIAALQARTGDLEARLTRLERLVRSRERPKLSSVGK